MSEARPPLSLRRAMRLLPAGAGVPSPCVGVCRMDAATGWCEGCFRSLDEIAAWSRADEADKRSVWARVESRQAAAESS